MIRSSLRRCVCLTRELSSERKDRDCCRNFKTVGILAPFCAEIFVILWTFR